MNIPKRLSLFSVMCCISVLLLSCISSNAETYYYATTNMTWAEFYAGEINNTADVLKSAGLDAFSTPTTQKPAFWPLSYDVTDGESTMYGLKDVPVRISSALYETAKNSGRFTFASDDVTFTEYKEFNSDGTFGKMTDSGTVTNTSAVTLSSGATAVFGNYELAPSGVTIPDRQKYYGAILTTTDSSGTTKKYGLRHNNNLWVNSTVGLTYEEGFREKHHNVLRPHEYTSDLEGKTVTNITYILLDSPDVSVNCSVFLKNSTTAAVKTANGYSEPGKDIPIKFVFTNAADDSKYTLATLSRYEYGEVTRRGQKSMGWSWKTLDAEKYTYSDGTLIIKGEISIGEKYQATFTSEKYSDIQTEFEVFTTNATSNLIFPQNNLGGLQFLLTPQGKLASVDETLEENKFVNASDYTTSSDNKSEIYNSGISGTGFGFDIEVKNVSSDYRAIVGFGKICYLTADNLGDSIFNKLTSKLKSMTVGESGFYEFPDFSSLSKDVGIAPKFITPDGTIRDLTEHTGAGLMISDDKNIMIYYGSMIADANSGDITEGEFLLSPEGEHLIADGKKDSHLRAVMYLEITDSTASTVSEPKMDISEKSADILSALGLPSDTKIRTAMQKAKPRSESEVSTSMIETLKNNNRKIAKVLPSFTVSEDAVYVFNVDLSSLSSGTSIYYYVEPIATNSFYPAENEDDTTAKFFDNGTLTTTVPTGKNIDVATFMKTGKTYEPLLTTNMTASDTQNSLGSSSGGCNAMIFAPAILIGISLLKLKK